MVNRGIEQGKLEIARNLIGLLDEQTIEDIYALPDGKRAELIDENNITSISKDDTQYFQQKSKKKKEVCIIKL